MKDEDEEQEEEQEEEEEVPINKAPVSRQADVQSLGYKYFLKRKELHRNFNEEEIAIITRDKSTIKD